MKYKVGDWVRFLWDEKFVIGKLEYIGGEHPTMGQEYYTDAGTVYEKYVLEARSEGWSSHDAAGNGLGGEVSRKGDGDGAI